MKLSWGTRSSLDIVIDKTVPGAQTCSDLEKGETEHIRVRNNVGGKNVETCRDGTKVAKAITPGTSLKQ